MHKAAGGAGFGVGCQRPGTCAERISFGIDCEKMRSFVTLFPQIGPGCTFGLARLVLRVHYNHMLKEFKRSLFPSQILEFVATAAY